MLSGVVPEPLPGLCSGVDAQGWNIDGWPPEDRWRSEYGLVSGLGKLGRCPVRGRARCWVLRDRPGALRVGVLDGFLGLLAEPVSCWGWGSADRMLRTTQWTRASLIRALRSGSKTMF
jgi:hypothetical protein